MNANDHSSRSHKPAGVSYSVGYGKPPAGSRFKSGTSGNPRGRPRGARSVTTLLREMMSRRITITDSGKSKRVPLLEALLLMLSRQALKGDYRAARMLLDAAGRLDKEASPSSSPPMEIEDARRSIRDRAMKLLGTVSGEPPRQAEGDAP